MVVGSLQAGGRRETTQTPGDFHDPMIGHRHAGMPPSASSFAAFRLNRDTHAVLMDEIERFKKQPGTQPTPEHRAIVEDLSGWKYEQLWGKGRL